MSGNYYDLHFRDVVHEKECPWHEEYGGPTHACAEDHGFRWYDFPPVPVSSNPLPEKCPVFDPGDWAGGPCGQPIRELECDGRCPTLQDVRYAG